MVQKGTGKVAELEGKVLDAESSDNHHFMQFVHDSFHEQNLFMFGGGPVEIGRVGNEFLVVAPFTSGINPGGSSLSVYWFDINSKPIAMSHVDTDRRTGYKSCKLLQPSNDLPSAVIDSELAGGWTNGSERQVFEFENHELHPIWLAKSDGTLVQNNYAVPNFGCDTERRPFTKAEMLAILQGNDTVRQMDALIWLDGDHLQPSPKVVNVLTEPIAQRINHRSLATDPEVIAAVRHLKDSTNKWVAQEASAFKPETVLPEQPGTQFHPELDHVEVKDLVVGKGGLANQSLRSVQPGDEVIIKYDVTFPDGRVAFARRAELEHLAQYRLDRKDVIAGLSKGLLGMKAGGKRQINIPYPLALGEAGTQNVEFDWFKASEEARISHMTDYNGDPFPPKSGLVYTVELYYACAPNELPRETIFGQRDSVLGQGKVITRGDIVKTQTMKYSLEGARYGGAETRSLVAGSSSPLTKALVGMRPGGARRIIATEKSDSFFIEPYVFEIKVLSISGKTKDR